MGRALEGRGLLSEFDVPVGEIDEVSPTVVAGAGVVDIDKGAPAGFAGWPDEVHAGLVGEFVGFAGVAGDAGANDIFPSGLAAFFAGDDVIEIKFVAIEGMAAVLAGIFIALENVVPGEFDFFFGESVKHEEDNHPGNADAEGDALDHFVFGVVAGEIAPTGEVMGEKIFRLVLGDYLGVALVEESEGPADGAGIDGLPEPVEHKHRVIQNALGTFHGNGFGDEAQVVVAPHDD